MDGIVDRILGGQREEFTKELKSLHERKDLSIFDISKVMNPLIHNDQSGSDGDDQRFNFDNDESESDGDEIKGHGLFD